MLVLGAGLQGSACAYDLLRNPAVESVLLADLRLDALPRFLEPLRADPRLRLRELDATDDAAVSAAMAEADACLNALPYYFNLRISELAVEAGLHCADLGGNTDLVFQQLELDERARAAGITVIPDCGLAPGMGNILAAAGIREMDEAKSVRIRVGGLPKDPEPPLNYHIVYSLEGVLDYYTTPGWVLRDGEPEEVEPLTGLEEVDFPELGRLEAFHTAGGLSTMPWAYRGRVAEMDYKTLRYPGHADLMHAIRSLGLLELEPVRVGEQEVVPRELFIACATPRLRRPEARDVVALRVEVQGVAAGRPRTVRYDLLDAFDETTGISAMERATGFSLSITGQLQATGRIAGPGASTPDQCVPADAYIEELGRRGVRIERSER